MHICPISVRLLNPNCSTCCCEKWHCPHMASLYTHMPDFGQNWLCVELVEMHICPISVGLLNPNCSTCCCEKWLRSNLASLLTLARFRSNLQLHICAHLHVLHCLVFHFVVINTFPTGGVFAWIMKTSRNCVQ